MIMDTDQIIAEDFINSHTLEAIQAIEKLEYEDIADFIHKIPLDLTIKILLQMNNYKAAKCLELLNMNLAVEFIDSIDLLSAELLLRQCDKKFRNTLLDKVAPKKAAVIRKKLSYTENSVGAYMKPKVFSLQKSLTVIETKELMKKEKELIASEIFVTDETGKLEGIVQVAQLVLAEGKDQISSILTKDAPNFFVDQSIHDISDHPAWLTYRTLPVIQRSGALIGSLHFEDISKKNLKKDTGLNKQMVETASALGELYWIGLTGLLQSITNSD